MPPKGKYTDPKLRDQVKEEVQQSDKGGSPGQWSARKAQMMASEYKKRGGDYTTDKETGQDESQKNLSKWTEEEWQTKEGSGNAKKEDGTEKRYLPKKAWEQMSDKEKEETDQKKQEGSKQGKQHVANTKKAQTARKDTGKDAAKTNSDASNNDGKAPRRGRSADKKSDGKQNGETDENSKGDEKEANAKSSAGQKRGQSTQADSGATKKQKSGDTGPKKATVGSKHDPAEPPAPAASASRLPKKGQKASWKALPGWVHGEVIEIVTEQKTVDGKNVKGSKKDPRIVLKSDNGKIAVHKAEAVHFE